MFVEKYSYQIVEHIVHTLPCEGLVKLTKEKSESKEN